MKVFLGRYFYKETKAKVTKNQNGMKGKKNEKDEKSFSDVIGYGNGAWNVSNSICGE